MKFLALITTSVFSLSSCIAQENNSKKEAVYIESEGFSALNLPFS